MTNGKILKNNTLPIVLFTDTSVNVIKKDLWFISCHFLKFNNKPIFDYQNIHLLYIYIYGSIRENMDLKGHRSGYNKIIGNWSTNSGTRINWEASRKGAWSNKACREHRKNIKLIFPPIYFEVLLENLHFTHSYIHVNNRFVLFWKISKY